MSERTTERRNFSRVLFDAWAELRQGEAVWHTTVIDVSLQGLLVWEPEEWRIDESRPVRAVIRLETTAVIHMTLLQRRRGDGLLGFSCEQMDVESAGNLRRLVELNLGDPQLLERQLGALVATERG